MGFAAEKIEQNKEVTPPARRLSQKPHYLDENFHGKTKRAAILETGELFAVVLVLLAAARQYYGHPTEDALGFILAALLQYEVSLRYPTLFYPIWKTWMWIGTVLEFTTSHLILVISWFVMVVPVGLGLKLFGKSPINQTWKDSSETYWDIKPTQDFKLLERQF